MHIVIFVSIKRKRKGGKFVLIKLRLEQRGFILPLNKNVSVNLIKLHDKFHVSVIQHD